MPLTDAELIGKRVRFKAGPNSIKDSFGMVRSIAQNDAAKPRGRHAFATIDCEDDKVRKMRPGALELAPKA